MTLLYIDGFEDLSPWFLRSGGAPTIVAGRNGNCVQVQTNSEMVYSIPPAAQGAAITIGFAWRSPGAIPNGPINFLMFWDGTHANVQGSVSIQNTSGQLAVNRSTGTVLVTSGNIIAANTWYYIELQYKVDAAVGTVSLSVNGSVVASGSSLNTKGNPSGGAIESVSLQGFSSSALQYDDLYIALAPTTPDAVFGDCRVENLYPNGNGSANQWVNDAANSTNNYTHVSETGTPDTTTWTQSATSGQQDMYTLTDLSALTQAVLAVQPTAYIEKTDPTARQFKIVTRRTVDTKSAALTLDTVYGNVATVLTTDPETGLAWTPTNVNALQAGVEVA